MKELQGTPLSGITRRKIVIALIISLSVSAFLIARTFEPEAIRSLRWSWHFGLFAAMALAMMAVRHLAYMLRVWLVTGRVFSMRQSFEVVMMWEFASVATPSTVGGVAVAVFLLNKEGLNLGKSTASVMLITFLDNLFFVVSGLLMIGIVGSGRMFSFGDACTNTNEIPFLSAFGGVKYLFLAGVGFSLFLTLVLGWGILGNAGAVKKFLKGLFSLPLLRRWQHKAEEAGEELVLTSREFRSQPAGFWLLSFGATVIAWTMKYFVVNTVISAFAHLTGMDQLVVLSRVLALWVIMLIPFTPGASGVAEVSFIALMCRFLPAGLGGTIAFLWRTITFYPYLILGSLFMPVWLRRVYARPVTGSD